MNEPKMKENENSVTDFIESVESEKKKADAYQLLAIFEEVTGYKAKMWGPSIIGFGSYHYKYESGREGDAPLVGFSPRKAKISLYLDYESEEREKLLENFGKHTKSKACIYVNKLADIDANVLKDLIKHTVEKYQSLYPYE
ncbi:hypothetical protein CSV80_14680 [Sporosarcina sp. P12(2017)]|uniref:DUF1801 domain-containing protein n=1 Tax=unclassified Sporosarcina TaxID=2647733 RepID=UPI000C1668D9|nr:MULTISPECIES: DUF1801 domain-containing protein [unclassified Sporosarcina]PIC56487.1 hypothetical protein CSV81_14545 [Sporosarcina sp. P10]PIC59784.1 hypothetical protein CSV80_14680 [Sporosarcina sp. P12(2017)]